MELGGVPQNIDEYFSLGTYILCTQFFKELRTRHFIEPTFRASGATNHWNNNEQHSES